MDLHIRGQRDIESLTEQERLTWMVWLFTWITQTEDGFVARRSGIPGMEWVDRYLLGVAVVLRSSGGAVVWPRMRAWFDEDFVTALDKKIDEDSVTYLQMTLE